MEKKYRIILIILLCGLLPAGAQQRLTSAAGTSASGRSLGTHDRNGNPIDTTAVTDANTVPIGLFSWKVDKRFGNITPVPVDTIQTGFQNTNDVGGPTGQFNYLGNLGSPRMSRIFFDRPEESQFIFLDPYDFSVQMPQDVVFTNTLSPFTNLTYYKSLNSRNGEERFKSYFAVNANKRFGFGFNIDYLYGRGMYTDQNTAFFNGNFFTYYRGDKYELHFIFSNNNMKMAENGGIADDRYITNPLDMAEGKKQYNSTDIPTNLNKVWNHNTSFRVFLTHRYNLGFYKGDKEKKKAEADSLLAAAAALPDSVMNEMLKDSLLANGIISDSLHTDSTLVRHKPTSAEAHRPPVKTPTIPGTPANAATETADTTEVAPEFVPVTSFIHTFQADLDKRKYITQDNAQALKLYEYNFFGNDSTDITKRSSVKNTFGIALREGFNKWAKAGLTAFITHEYRDFTLSDTTGVDDNRILKHYKENNLSVGGELLKEQGTLLHYRILGEVGIAGEDAGQFRLEGKGDLNFRFLGDTVRLEANAYIKNLNPVFFYRHFHSKHYWWDNDDLSKIMRTRIEGTLNIRKWGTTLRAGVENIKNYTYLDNASVGVTNNQGEVTSYKNNAVVRQDGDNIQVLTAMWQQKLKAGIFHLDTEVVYQKSSNEEVLPLPELSSYANLYLKTALVKNVFNVELGADARY
ncbi:MAG: putative porin, partial [Bacteroides sp.]|nr:putative porin [Bacteroides sp.]